MCYILYLELINKTLVKAIRSSFLCHFWPLLNWALTFGAAWSLHEFDSSLNPTNIAKLSLSKTLKHTVVFHRRSKINYLNNNKILQTLWHFHFGWNSQRKVSQQILRNVKRDLNLKWILSRNFQNNLVKTGTDFSQSFNQIFCNLKMYF